VRWLVGRIVPAPVAVAATALLSAGCGQSSAATASASSSIRVVASNDVWGDVAAVVGGSRVSVTSVISDPAVDPHSFEANARTELAVSRARVVIENGGGYDDFMTRLVRAAGSKATVIDAVEVSGKAAAAKAAGTEVNEHVWYDFPSVGRVADRIAAALGRADPRDAPSFRANAAEFRTKLDALITRERSDRTRTAGAGVAITEPVPLYLLQALGAVNKTPPAFSHAVEDGDGVSPSVLRQTTALFSSGAVKALVYNAQTGDVQTAALRKAAEAAHVAVVPVTETLPPGTNYLTWMSDNLHAISKALGS
jgi:zinc/manganese transport system substrate-binding protein